MTLRELKDESAQNIQGAKAPAVATGKAQDSDGDG